MITTWFVGIVLAIASFIVGIFPSGGLGYNGSGCVAGTFQFCVNDPSAWLSSLGFDLGPAGDVIPGGLLATLLGWVLTVILPLTVGYLLILFLYRHLPSVGGTATK